MGSSGFIFLFILPLLCECSFFALGPPAAPPPQNWGSGIETLQKYLDTVNNPDLRFADSTFSAVSNYTFTEALDGENYFWLGDSTLNHKVWFQIFRISTS
jgi:hypothetical protein